MNCYYVQILHKKGERTLSRAYASSYQKAIDWAETNVLDIQEILGVAYATEFSDDNFTNIVRMTVL